MKFHQQVWSVNSLAETVFTNKIWRKDITFRQIVYLTLSQRKTWSREIKNQRNKNAKQDATCSKCHPATALAKQLFRHIEKVQDSSGDQDAENCGDGFECDLTDSGKD